MPNIINVTPTILVKLNKSSVIDTSEVARLASENTPTPIKTKPSKSLVTDSKSTLVFLPDIPPPLKLI